MPNTHVSNEDEPDELKAMRQAVTDYVASMNNRLVTLEMAVGRVKQSTEILGLITDLRVTMAKGVAGLYGVAARLYRSSNASNAVEKVDVAVVRRLPRGK